MNAIKTGKLICALRTKQGLTQKQLAEQINVSDKAVSKWERGEGVPDVIVLATLANLYKLTINDFLRKDKKQKIGNAYFSKALICMLGITLVFFLATLAFFILIFFII